MSRPRPRPTVRLKLTLAYGGLFLLAGAILLTLNYALVRRSISHRRAAGRRRRSSPNGAGPWPGACQGPTKVIISTGGEPVGVVGGDRSP